MYGGKISFYDYVAKRRTELLNKQNNTRINTSINGMNIPKSALIVITPELIISFNPLIAQYAKKGWASDNPRHGKNESFLWTNNLNSLMNNAVVGKGAKLNRCLVADDVKIPEKMVLGKKNSKEVLLVSKAYLAKVGVNHE